MTKCPVCGYNFGYEYNYSKEILNMINQKSNRLKKYLKIVNSEVMLNVPSEYSTRGYFLFIKSIENVKDRLVIRAIEHYIKAGYHFQGKGFNYLKAIIKNESTNKKSKLRNEYKRLGRTPKIRKIK